jgi:hypothetical protein
MRWLKWIVLGCLGGVLLALSMMVVSAEAPASVTTRSRFTALAQTPDPSRAGGWSIRRQTEFLFDCDAALRGYYSLEMLYAGDAVRDRAIDVCDRVATRMVSIMPTQSFAWEIKAAAAARRSDWAVMNSALVQSSLTAPYEQWIAEKRAGLAEDNLPMLTPEGREAQGRDLQMLVTTRTGVASIARRYVGFPEFRDRIVALVEQMTPADQSRFLFNVRSVYGLPPTWQPPAP